MTSMPESEKPVSLTDSDIQDSAIQRSGKTTEKPVFNDAKSLPEASVSPPSEFTFQASLVLAGAFANLFCSVGFINAFGVFEEYYQETLLSSYSSSTIAWIGSFNIFCLFGGALGTGILNDKYGPRVLIFTGTIMTLLAVFMVSLCKQYYQFFLAQGLLLGLGLSALFCPAIAVVQLYFKRQRALSLGITVSGSSLGGVIWPIALRRLIVEVGFGWALRISAFIMLPLLALSFLVVKVPYSTGPKVVKKLDFSIMKSRVLVLTGIGMFFVYLGLFTPFFYVTPYALSIGIDSNTSFYMISVINGTSLFGRVLPGILADRYGAFNLAILTAVLSGITVACMQSCTNLAGVVVFSLAYGLVSGAIISLQGACATQTVEPKNYGTAIGIVMGFLSIAGLVGTPITGQLLDHSGWLAVVLWSGFTMISGAMILVAARLSITRTIFAKC